MNTTTMQRNEDIEGTPAFFMEGMDPESSESDVEILDVDASEAQVVSRSSDLVRRDPLDVYMQDTKRFPLLSREEEHLLAVRLVEEGDAAAARTLVESNLRLVVKIAYEYQRAHQNLLDIVQEGSIGLMQAVSKYDPYRGVKLSSYASWWIRAYMLKFILNNHRMVKLGTTQAQRKLFFNLKKERDRWNPRALTPTQLRLPSLSMFVRRMWSICKSDWRPRMHRLMRRSQQETKGERELDTMCSKTPEVVVPMKWWKKPSSQPPQGEARIVCRFAGRSRRADFPSTMVVGRADEASPTR